MSVARRNSPTDRGYRLPRELAREIARKAVRGALYKRGFGIKTTESDKDDQLAAVDEAIEHVGQACEILESTFRRTSYWPSMQAYIYNGLQNLIDGPNGHDNLEGVKKSIQEDDGASERISDDDERGGFNGR